ncbi:MAG: NAD(P)/FAD-dependent oxidoreductase [Paracoccaceae bacterium]
MAKTFDTIVIGKGMMGSATARHLALSKVKTALIGPDEPAEKSRHSGVFASHYDEGRITRSLDTDSDWSRLAQCSMARYAEIAKQGNTGFFVNRGALLTGCQSYISKVVAASSHNDVKFQLQNQEELSAQFPFFAFPENTHAIFEPSAGYINPRGLVRAQTLAADSAGATIIAQQVVDIHEDSTSVTVTTADGQIYIAGNLVIAAGAFSNLLLAKPIDYRIATRTVVLFELDEKETRRLASMPTLIHLPDGTDGPYLLPPIRYPDGKTYIKIGGDPIDNFISTQNELTQWFQNDGTPKGRDFLIAIMSELMPDLRYEAVRTVPCVTTLTPGGKPVIQHQTDRIILLTGGNGAAAKSSDEIGRLAARLAQGYSLADENYASNFSAG